MLNLLLGFGNTTRNQICCLSAGKEAFLEEAGFPNRGYKEPSAMCRVTIGFII